MSVMRLESPWRLPLALAFGVGAGRLASDIGGWIFYGTPLAVAQGAVNLATHVLPLVLPCLIWPLLREPRSARVRATLTVTILAAWLFLAFEVGPRASMGLLREQIPEWSETALGMQRPDTWTTTGIVEHAGAVDPALVKAELLHRAQALCVLLAALLPAWRRVLSSHASCLAWIATAGGAAAVLLAPPGWPALVAGPLVVAACAVATARPRAAGEAPALVASVSARAVQAGLLFLAGFAVTRWSCQIGSASTRFWERILGG